MNKKELEERVIFLVKALSRLADAVSTNQKALLRIQKILLSEIGEKKHDN